MQINRLSLENFRSYVRLELDLPAGVTLLHGDNAQGKTNILEAIYYVATTRSPYTAQDSQLINWDAARDDAPQIVGRVTAEFSTKRGPSQVEIRLIQETKGGNRSFRREALVNRRKVRLLDLLTSLRVVQFLPHDIQIITGSPAGRRRYLNIALCQTDNLYCRTLSSYNKILDQRNATLRNIAETGTGQDLLPIYTEKLASLGGAILVRRARFLQDLAHMMQEIHYEALTAGRETLRLSYLPRLDAPDNGRQNNSAGLAEARKWSDWLSDVSEEAMIERLQAGMTALRSRDIALGRTMLGPHRDDWRMWVDGHPLESYGSRGQQRTAMLALKLAEIQWMTKEAGETPVLLLDEVMAELDESRRSLLLAAVTEGAQAVMTATEPRLFEPSFLSRAKSLLVKNGQVIDQGAS